MASETSWSSSWVNWCSSELPFWRIPWRGQSVVLLSFFKIRIIIGFLRRLWLIFFIIVVVFRAFMKMIVIFIWILILFWLILFFRWIRSALLFLLLVLTIFLFLDLKIFIFFFFFTVLKILLINRKILKILKIKLLTIFYHEKFIFLRFKIFHQIFFALFYQLIWIFFEN